MAAGTPTYPAWVARLGTATRRRGEPTPVRVARPLVLANRVSNRRSSLGEAMCITEMSLMMACWKQSEFSDAACTKEIQAFLDCSSKAEAERKEKLREDSLDQSGNLSTKQVNRLLNRFPNITYYY